MTARNIKLNTLSPFKQLTDVADLVMSVEFESLQEEPKLNVLMFLTYFCYALNYYELLTEDGKKLFYQIKGHHAVILFLQNVQTHFRLRVKVDELNINPVREILIDNLWSDIDNRLGTLLAEEDIITRQNKRADWETVIYKNDWLVCLFLHRMSPESNRYWQILRNLGVDVVKPTLPKDEEQSD